MIVLKMSAIVMNALLLFNGWLIPKMIMHDALSAFFSLEAYSKYVITVLNIMNESY